MLLVVRRWIVVGERKIGPIHQINRKMVHESDI